MATVDLVVPSLGESVSEATIAKWTKNDGDYVTADDVVAELETDKAALELPPNKAGTLKIIKAKGSTVKVGEVIATIDTSGQKTVVSGQKAEVPAAPVALPANAVDLSKTSLDDLSPAVRGLVVENKLQKAVITATGPGGRLTTEDVQGYLGSGVGAQKADAAAAATSQKIAPTGFISTLGTTAVPDRTGEKKEVGSRESGVGSQKTEVSLGAPSRPLAADEEREEMSRLRQTVARRLVEAQHNTASLTTFNEVDMSAVMGLREKYKESFEKQHGIGLGFMSFFAKAVMYAFKSVPQVNWTVDGTTIIKRKSVHLGIAVSTEKGLMVPVVRNAQALSMAQIESEIKRLALKARDAKITVDDMAGGTFTITNGGVFGSLLSTPILNVPQSGILGMHKIEKRAVVVTEGGKDAIVIRPMMYLALTYDHRLVDWKQSVTFLVKVKEALEDPARILLEV